MINTNIENIGFKYSPLGKIPSDWEVKTLESVGHFSKGKGILKDQLAEIGLPCIRYGEIYTTYDFIVRNLKSFISEEVSKESQVIKKGDILFAGSGETTEEIGKAVAYIGDEKAYAGGDVIILSTFDSINAEWLSFALETNVARKQKRVLGQGNSVVHIYPRDLSKIKLTLPPLPEQTSIAEVLCLWDKAISTVQATIEQVELRNKWLMQELLTGKRRLKGFEETKWKTKKLSDCLIYTPREVPKPSSSFFALGIRCHAKGIFHKNDFDPEDLAMDVLYEVKENDLIVNITFAWEHAIAIAGKQDDCGLVSHRFPTYIFKTNNAIHEFFRYFILQKKFKYQLDLISPGGAGRNRVMSKKDFPKIEVIIPDVEEQKAIANILDNAFNELSLLRSKLEKLKEQKKGLMQLLLTGKKRLKLN